MPLRGLVNLERIQILREVYDNLPEEEREIFPVPVYDPMKYTTGGVMVALTE
jgi:hypothetical protein